MHTDHVRQGMLSSATVRLSLASSQEGALSRLVVSFIAVSGFPSTAGGADMPALAKTLVQESAFAYLEAVGR
jgi:hypothetical protein